MQIGFDNDKYLRIQSEHIKKRIAEFGGKLYLEFGGKLFDDYHASRVLPGFHPDSKITMLRELREDVEIVIVINSGDIEKNKIRGDLGITYDMDVLRLIDAFTGKGLFVGSVVLTQFAEQPSAIAYEAATADLNDVNMIDPFHLEAYGEKSVNYNRDVEIFPVLKAIFERIAGESPYKSPTDMGVNMAGFCISDDAVVRRAAQQEILRRYYQAMCDRRKGIAGDEPVMKLELLMKKAELTVSDRPVVMAANVRDEETGGPAAAIQMEDGTIITGKTSPLLGASSAMLQNALKYLAGIDDKAELLTREIIEPLQDLKTKRLGNNSPLLHLNELLIALEMRTASDENAKAAISELEHLAGLEVHSSVILSSIDVEMFKRLGMNLTCEPVYENNTLYHN